MKITRRTVFRMLGFTLGAKLLPAIGDAHAQGAFPNSGVRTYFIDANANPGDTHDGQPVFRTFRAAHAHIAQQGVVHALVLVKADAHSAYEFTQPVSRLETYAVRGVSDFRDQRSAVAMMRFNATP